MKKSLIALGMLLALCVTSDRASRAAVVSPNSLSRPSLLVEVQQGCTRSKCISLESRRAGNLKMCKSLKECESLAVVQANCTAEAVDRCNKGATGDAATRENFGIRYKPGTCQLGKC